MDLVQEFAEYFILSLGIIIFIGFPICALTNCLFCKKRNENVYIEFP